MATEALINALQQPHLYEHDVKAFKVIETHISWVLLTGDYVYKIKKPLNFGFLDFSTLAKRKFYCQEEIRLNKRFAPEIYLTTVPIYGSEQNPNFNQNGPIIEYAVKMRQFEEDKLLSRMIDKKPLTMEILQSLASKIANVHLQAASVVNHAVLGTPDHVMAPVRQNFDQMLPLATDSKDKELLQTLAEWSEIQFEKLSDLLQQRYDQGFIRECHGDLYLDNIAYSNNKLILFDCIEFNEDFRWTDTMADVGFLLMDFHDHQQVQQGNIVLNHYLFLTGDYAGIQLLPFYFVYRALVRAKVNLLNYEHIKDQQQRHGALQACKKYLNLAHQYIQPTKARLVITHGFCCSGKSTVSKLLVEHGNFIELRSDVERKRMFKLPIEEHHYQAVLKGLYQPVVTDNVYAYLASLAELLLRAGYSVVVDATFLKQGYRKIFHEIANELQVNMVIIDCYAREEILTRRIQDRMKTNDKISDAYQDILTMQYSNNDPLTAEEKSYCITINTEKPLKIDDLYPLILNTVT